MSYNFKGNRELLDTSLLGVFCSQKIDLASYYEMGDFIETLSDLPLVYAGGWQSNIEKKVLRTFSKNRIVYFLAKSINCYKPSSLIQKMLDNQNALVVSNIPSTNRVDKQTVKQRDGFILSVVNKFLILSMSENGHVENFVIDALQLLKTVYLFDHFTNSKWFGKYPSLKPVSKNNINVLI